MKVIVYSIGRSGSTLVAQMIRALPSVKIRSSHDLVRNFWRRKMIVPYRDFRDVMISFWRLGEEISFDELNLGRQATRAELEKYTRKLLVRVHEMEINIERNPNALLLRYEDFYRDFEYLFDQLQTYLGIEFDADLRRLLSEKYSLVSNRDRASKMSTFKTWDSEGIHGKHVLSGDFGTWRQFVPEK